MDRFKPGSALLTLLLAVTLAACGGGDAPAGDRDATASAESEPSAATRSSTGDPEALADRGEDLFRQNGCNACHTFGGGRLVGPDLVGVTERREKAWIERMIVNPDSMLQNDTIAKRLLGEYYTPMQDVGVTDEQAEALYHYLRRETERAGSTDP